MTIPRRKGDPIVVDADEHPRPDTTLEALAKLPTPFRKEGGSVTAGNASRRERRRLRRSWSPARPRRASTG